MRTAQPRRVLGTGLALTALLLGTTSAALAQDGEETAEETVEATDVEDEEPLVSCSSDDDISFLGDLIECTAEELEPGEAFEWTFDYYALDPDLGDVDDPDGLTDEEFEKFAELVEDGGGYGEASPAGVGTFSFTIPVELDIGVLGLFDGVVLQGDEYEEVFGGLIFGDFDVAELACTPDPAVPGALVTCEADDEPGADFDWAVQLLSVEDLEELAGFDEELLDDDDLDLDALIAELESLEAFEDVEDLDGLEDLLVEGTGTVDEDGTLLYDFKLPSDTTAVAYATFFVSDTGVGFFIGEIAEPAEDSAGGEPPVAQPTDRDSTPAPVTVPRPTRVDTGAGGAADGTPGTGGGLLALGGILALLGVTLARRRRVTI
jgi:hypothetical protein